MPPIGSENCLIRVSHCGLNFADLLMIKGTYQDTPETPFIPGMEICGEVIEAGSDVDHVSVGDRIAAFCGQGGLAEYANVDASRCIVLPETMPSATAAGFQIAYGTSHLALSRRARLQPDETLVVLGAAGGVGLTAVEIGHAMGARVIGVARGAEKRAIAERAGANITFDTNEEDLRTALKDVGPVHVVYDAVGGALGEAALRALAPEGRFLVIGFASGDVPKPRLNHLLVKNIDVLGFYWGGYMGFDPAPLRASLSELMAWHGEGRLKPHISHVLPFEQVEDGLELLRNRTATGKVVIEITP
ncbi:MAG: NADPH:quinone oxidoreductase family protein [Pseudomonadota bacterium]